MSIVGLKSMTTPPKNYWFPAKTFGWGWGLPTCWQGWVVYVIYVALLFAGIVEILWERKSPPGLVVYAIGLSLVLTFVCWLKGEKLAWRSDGKEE